MRYATAPGTAVLFLFSLAAAACDSPDRALLQPDTPLLASSGSTLIECPISETRSVEQQVGVLGGTIELDGHRMTVPEGALLAPTTFTLTVPRSNYVEIEIRADGEESFEFLEAVSITISYDRCTRSNLDKAELTAWQIDPLTKELLEHMGGTDDKAETTVTFTSGHLSGFAIAN